MTKSAGLRSITEALRVKDEALELFIVEMATFIIAELSMKKGVEGNDA